MSLTIDPFFLMFFMVVKFFDSSMVGSFTRGAVRLRIYPRT